VSYCFGASVMHSHLYQGGGVVFDSRFMFPDKVLLAINTYGCTTFAGVPAVYSILLRRSNLRSIPLPGLRRFLQAGGALAPESVREICSVLPTAEFFIMYGQTEATSRISTDSDRRGISKIVLQEGFCAAVLGWKAKGNCTNPLSSTQNPILSRRPRS
jgi:long-chain acyl-CoA synthetase